MTTPAAPAAGTAGSTPASDAAAVAAAVAPAAGTAAPAAPAPGTAAAAQAPGPQAKAPEADVIGDGVEAAKTAEAAKPLEFKVPEGMKPDDKLIEKFGPIAKELGLKSEGAQKLVDLYASTVQGYAKAADEAFAKQQNTWRDEVKADKEIGGQNFEQTRADVGRFFNAFDKDGSIRKGIAQLGLGNHPALVRLAVRAAKLIKEDGISGGSAGGSGEVSEEDALRVRYPTMFK